MARAAQDSLARARLDDPPGVEDRDAVGDRRHHAEVVRDQDDREVVLAPEAVEQTQDPRLHGHVERGRRLVGDQQLRAGTRARSRSRSAGACRPRTGADTRAARLAADPGSAPAASSSSACRSAARRPRPRWSRTCSVSCRPIVSIGWSDVIGSWKTIARSRPAISRSRRRGRARAGRARRSGRAPRRRRRRAEARAGRASTSSSRCRSRPRRRTPRRARRRSRRRRRR